MENEKLNPLIDKICTLVRSCGDIMLHADRGEAEIDKKSGRGNFVTEYDKKIEKILKKELLRILPSASFFGEEGDNVTDVNHGYCFVVDPIDGTCNFIRDGHISCISVGLLKDGEAYIGVIYNPYLNEMFTAEKGKGAYCNGKAIHVSEIPMSEAVITVGTAPYYEEFNEITFKTAYKMFKKGLDIRRSGSAAYDLSSLACGRTDVFFEYRLSPWDYAAGAVIVSEAGGILTTLDGKPLTFEHPCSICASNGLITYKDFE